VPHHGFFGGGYHTMQQWCRRIHQTARAHAHPTVRSAVPTPCVRGEWHQPASSVQGCPCQDNEEGVDHAWNVQIAWHGSHGRGAGTWAVLITSPQWWPRPQLWQWQWLLYGFEQWYVLRCHAWSNGASFQWGKKGWFRRPRRGHAMLQVSGVAYLITSTLDDWPFGSWRWEVNTRQSTLKRGGVFRFGAAAIGGRIVCSFEWFGWRTPCRHLQDWPLSADYIWSP